MQKINQTILLWTLIGTFEAFRKILYDNGLFMSCFNTFSHEIKKVIQQFEYLIQRNPLVMSFFKYSQV